MLSSMLGGVSRVGFAGAALVVGFPKKRKGRVGSGRASFGSGQRSCRLGKHHRRPGRLRSLFLGLRLLAGHRAPSILAAGWACPAFRAAGFGFGAGTFSRALSSCISGMFLLLLRRSARPARSWSSVQPIFRGMLRLRGRRLLFGSRLRALGRGGRGRLHRRFRLRSATKKSAVRSRSRSAFGSVGLRPPRPAGSHPWAEVPAACAGFSGQALPPSLARPRIAAQDAALGLLLCRLLLLRRPGASSHPGTCATLVLKKGRGISLRLAARSLLGSIFSKPFLRASFFAISLYLPA